MKKEYHGLKMEKIDYTSFMMAAGHTGCNAIVVYTQVFDTTCAESHEAEGPHAEKWLAPCAIEVPIEFC